MTRHPPDLVIREASSGDAASMSALLTQLGYPAGAAALPARLDRLADTGRAVVFVAVSGGQVAGLAVVQIFTSLHSDEDQAWLTSLVVDQTARRTGVGRALVESAENWARARRAPRLSVNTGIHRSGAHAFYEKLGFVYTGRRYGKTLD